MRLRLAAVLAFAAVLSAGCLTGETPPANPLFGFCPQWEAGPGQQSGSLILNATAPTASQILAPASMHLRDRPFDMVRLRIDSMAVSGPGAISLTAFATANGTATQVNWRDFRLVPPALFPVIGFLPGAAEADHEFEAYLTSVSQDAPSHPGPVELRWRLEGNGTASVSYTATFHYKVCGAALGANP